MATGKTQSDITQKAVMVKDLIKDNYINELKELIKADHHFTAFIVISCGIEFLGKCISSTTDWFLDNHSKEDFNNALTSFESLIKYSTIGELNRDGASFYNIIRCGIIHSSVPKNGLTITEGKNNFPNEVGLRDLTEDFIKACNDLLNKKVKMGGGKSLDDVICYTS